MHRGKLDPALLLVSLALLAGGMLATAFGYTDVARWLWISSSLLLAVVIGVEVIVSLIRRQIGVDLIALLSITAALQFSQYLVAAVVAVMLASGRALEYFTSQRAERELKRLIQRAPTFAWQIKGDSLVRVALDNIVPGQQILVHMGDVIPLDGTLIKTGATIDESALTGESIPVEYANGATVRSGAVNVGSPFTLQVTNGASQSTYTGIVRMAEAARRSKAPFVRAADRFALMLIPITLLIAGAGWMWSQDPLRALAVVVVSTPCPLILAVPIAILSGISRCARRGILVKDGATLEALAKTRIVMLDKTGTLTSGHASIDRVETTGTINRDQLLYWAGSLAQGSPHPVSTAIAAAAQQRCPAKLGVPTEIVEHPGAGLDGHVDGHWIKLGSLAFVTSEVDEWSTALLARLEYQGISASFIAVDGKVSGAVLFRDPLRTDSAQAVRSIKRLGVQKVTMLTGDRLQTAQWVAISAGIDEVLANLQPQDKVSAVQAACAQATTMMVGDGINDAPALAAADIGVAMGAAGASAASEAAGVVLLVDRLDRVAQAIAIAQRSCSIARQSMLIGMGLSVLAMLVAAAGYLPPLAGAVLQEVIDVSVILNALRALTPSGWQTSQALPSDQFDRIGADHLRIAKVLETLNDLACDLKRLTPEQIPTALQSLIGLLEQQLLPHERDDENRLYPLLHAYLRGEDPLAALSHTHREIFRLVRTLKHLSDKLGVAPKTAELDEIHTTLIRLDTLVALHFSQESELYSGLDPR
jgi:heavy metal translocating P-type ATPase